MNLSVCRTVAAVVIAAGAIGGLADLAHAQNRIMVSNTVTIGGDGPAGMVGKASLERYGSILKLNQDQKDAAQALHEGYMTAYRQSAKDLQAGMEELRRSADESDDRGVFMTKMPEIQKKHRETTEKLETGLFADIKSLLAPDQEVGWGKVERMRRREVDLPRGTLSGESVDLVDVVSGLKLDAAALAGLVETLDQYEVELDRQLAAREKALADDDGFDMSKGFDMEKIQARMKASREAGAKVQEVNEKYARRLEGLLPEAERPAFADAIKKKSFPRVYRPSRVSKAIDAAMKFDDLDTGQRQALQSLKDSYERESAPANESWANAIKQSEQTGNGGTMGMRGGGQISFSFGEEEKGPLADARKARRELDDRTNDRMKSILTETQRSKLPKASDSEPGEAVDGGQMIIRKGG